MNPFLDLPNTELFTQGKACVIAEKLAMLRTQSGRERMVQIIERRHVPTAGRPGNQVDFIRLIATLRFAPTLPDNIMEEPAIRTILEHEWRETRDYVAQNEAQDGTAWAKAVQQVGFLIEAVATRYRGKIWSAARWGSASNIYTSEDFYSEVLSSIPVAVEKYNPERGDAFIGYLDFYLANARRILARKSSTVSLTVNQVDLKKQAETFLDQYEFTLGHNITIDQLAEYFDVTPSVMEAAFLNVRSMDAPSHGEEDDGVDLHNFIEDSDVSVEENYDSVLLMSRANALISSLAYHEKGCFLLGRGVHEETSLDALPLDFKTAHQRLVDRSGAILADYGRSVMEP